jgi:YidC/Oxa1 family membrane protein insertase
MRQEFRIIIAFALSLLILYAYYGLIAPPPLPPKEVVSHESGVVSQKGPTRDPQPTTHDPTLSPMDPEVDTVIRPVKDLVVETDKIRLVLSTQGAMIQSYILKDYHLTADQASPLIDLFPQGDEAQGLSLQIKGHASFGRVDVFELVADEGLKNGARRIVMAWQDKKIRLEKTFTIGGAATPYALQVDYVLTNRSDGTLKLAPQLTYQLRQKDEPKGGFFDFLKASARDIFSAEYLELGKLVAVPFEKAGSCLGPSPTGTERFPQISPDTTQLGWAAISGRYFLYALIPSTPGGGLQPHFRQIGKYVMAYVGPGETELTAGQSLTGAFQAYLGPKERGELKKVGAQLDRAIDYGWTAWITIPISSS